MERSTPIRVLYLIDKMRRSGAQSHLVQILRALDRARVQPSLCCLMEKGPLGEEVDRMGIPVEVLNLPTLYGPKAWRGMRRLVRLLKDRRIELVQTYLIGANIYGTLAAKLAGVPAVITSRRDMGFSRNWRLSLIEKWLVNPFVNRVIAVSDAVAEVARREWGLRNGKVVTISNGVQLADWEPSRYNRDGLREAWGFLPGEKIVGVITNLTAIKGHGDLLQAAALIVPVFPNVKFLLVGDGPLRPQIESQGAALGLSRHLIFTGSRPDIPDLLAMMDVSVLPSHSEGMSNTLLESMAMAKPVVATAVGGNPEVVVDGLTGLLVPPRDPAALAAAILKLLREEATAQRMGQDGRRRVEARFDIRQTTGSMMEVYDTVIRK